MKIVCDSCGAKYSIADDRVTGKVFKIRCKRCSEVIIVRGDQQQSQAGGDQADPSAQQPGAGIWHVVVEGEQAGPYTPQQLGEMLTAATIDWDAYVWTEGFDNWLPMREVSDLVAQITGQGGVQQAAPQAAGARAAAYRSAVHETLSGQPSMGADPFADDGGGSEAGLFGGGAAAASAGPDLFARNGGRGAQGPFGGDEGVVASAPSPRMAQEQAMTGARNENSVLFSLKNLQALATGSGSSLPPQTAAAAAGAGGYASGEGSGLIDIRALATATGMGESGGGAGGRDELLAIGTQGGAFGTLGSPMLSPVADDGDGNKKLLIWAGVAAIGIVCAAAVAIIYVMRPSAAPVGPPVAMLPQAPATAVAAAQPPAPEAPAPAEKPSEGELAAKAAADAKHTRESGSDHSSSESRRRRSSEASSSKSEPNEPAPAAAPAKDPAPSKPSGPKSIDELLDGALSGSPKPKTSEPAPAKSNLPESPSRDQVMSAMNGVKPAVQACAQGQGGVATVTVSVAGETGRVTNATVAGVTGPAGSCIAQAVRKAQFPKFQNKVFKVQFPFKL